MVAQQLADPGRGVGEGVLVGGEHLGGVESADPLEGVEVVAEGVGDQLGRRVLVEADVRGDPGQQVVPGEEAAVAGEVRRVLFLQVQADVAGGVPGGPDGAQPPPGEGEQLAGDDLPVGDGGPQARQGADAAARAGRPQGGDVLLGGSGGGQLLAHVVEPGAGLGGAGPYDDLGVGGVHRDPGAGGLADPAGQAVVVGVVVGDEHAVDVGDRDAEGGEAGDEGAPGLGVVPAGVDEDGAAAGVEDVDEGVAERVVGDRDLDAVDAAAVVGDVRGDGRGDGGRGPGFGGRRGLRRRVLRHEGSLSAPGRVCAARLTLNENVLQ